MRRHELRASRLPLLLRCAGSAWLPHSQADDPEELVRANEWGHLVHRWKETGRVFGSTPRNHAALERAILASGVDRLGLWPSGGHHESAVAVDIRGSRQVHRDDTPTPGWITGHSDFYYFFIDGILWVDDLKTGKWYDDGEGGNRYPQDARSTQLRLYALGIATLLGYTGDVVVSVTHWPRLPLTYRHRAPVRYWTRYTHAELQDFWGVLEQLWTDISLQTTLRPGDQCRFCPSRDYCIEAEPIPTYDWKERNS